MNFFSVRAYLNSLKPGTLLNLCYQDGSAETVRLFGVDQSEENPAIYVAPGDVTNNHRSIVFLHAVATINLGAIAKE